MKTQLTNSAFWLLLVLTALYYGYHEYAQLGPVSVHSWRQADGASFAYCYYKEGMALLEPKVMNMSNGENNAASEFPIMYYLSALLYHYFGVHAWIPRSLNFLAVALGLFFLYRLLRDVYQNWKIALAAPFLILGLPVLAYYGFNFLPNPVAYGIILIAAWAYFQYEKAGNMRYYYLMCILTLLGGLIKISLLIPFIAIGGVMLIEKLLPPERQKMKTPPWGTLIASIMLTTVATGAWYAWAAHYNHIHDSDIFMTDPNPIWKMASEDAYYTWQMFKRPDEFWHIIIWKYTLYLFLGLTAVNLILFRGLSRPAYIFLALTTLGSVSFLLLFYGQLLVHSYYWIDVLPLFTFLISLSLYRVKQSAPGAFKNPVVLIGLWIFVSANIHYTANKLQHYFYSEDFLDDLTPGFEKQAELQAFYQDHGIIYDSTLVSVVPDVTPNLDLYYLKLRGWSWPRDQYFNDENIKWQARNFGIDYFVVTDTSYFRKTDLKEVFESPKLVFNNSIYFYDLSRFKEGTK